MTFTYMSGKTHVYVSIRQIMCLSCRISMQRVCAKDYTLIFFLTQGHVIYTGLIVANDFHFSH